MADKNNKTVVQGNSLIDGCYSLTLDELRIISLAASKVDAKSTFKPVPIEITAQEFAEAYQFDVKNVYSLLKKSAKSARSKAVTLYEGSETIERSWFSELRYDTKTKCNSVKVIFGEFIRPHLYELSRDFTQVKFRYISKLDSAFSFRLYLWLIRESNLDKNKKNGVVTCQFDIETLKTCTGLQGKYPEYRKFKESILNPSVSKINLFTDLVVSFKGIRTGLKTTAIKFTFDAPKKTQSKPSLKLPPRPQVKAGSRLEGEYFNECIKTILAYEKENGGLSKDEASKLVSFFMKSGDKFAAEDYRLKYRL